MKTVRIYPSNINDRLIDEAVSELLEGNIIIYPTDTVYAIGCDATNAAAIERVCRLKNINPARQNLSIVCDGLSRASEYVRIDNAAFAIIKRNIPGPFTFILPPSVRLPKLFKNRRAVGLRIPDSTVACAIVSALDRPLLSTTVPLDGDFDACDPDSIALAMERKGVSLLVDAGPGGTEVSTVVDLTDSSSPEIVRQGLGDLQ